MEACSRQWKDGLSRQMMNYMHYIQESDIVANIKQKRIRWMGHV